MNDTSEDIQMDDEDWQKIVKSIPVVHDITEATAAGVIRQILKAVLEKNGLPLDKLDNMVATVIAHSLGDICFTAMHGLALPHGYISGLEKLLVGFGVMRHGSSIDFNALDGSRTQIFIIILCSNPNQPGYRQFLARLCKCIISGNIMSRLASVTSNDDLAALLCPPAC